MGISSSKCKCHEPLEPDTLVLSPVITSELPAPDLPPPTYDEALETVPGPSVLNLEHELDASYETLYSPPLHRTQSPRLTSHPTNGHSAFGNSISRTKPTLPTGNGMRSHLPHGRPAHHVHSPHTHARPPARTHHHNHPRCNRKKCRNALARNTAPVLAPRFQRISRPAVSSESPSSQYKAIYASSIPTGDWGEYQCRTWLTLILNERCGHRRGHAATLVNRFVLGDFTGVDLYLQDLHTWELYLGESDGRKVYYHIKYLREQKQAGSKMKKTKQANGMGWVQKRDYLIDT